MYGDSMKKSIRKLNVQALLEAGILLALAVWLFVYLVSGRYLTYVTPRMLPYLIGTIIVLIILTCITFTRLFHPNHRARVSHAFVLTLPLILLLFPHGMISVSTNQLSSVSASTAITTSPGTTQSPATGSEAESGAEETPADEISGLDSIQKRITITTDNFYDWMERLYNDCADYEGYTVSITGYVINGSDVFAANEFALARLVMTCCVADLSPVGVICKYDGADQLTADDWFSVEGTLVAGTYEIDGTTYTEPQLQVTSLTPTDEISGYLYPY